MSLHKLCLGVAFTATLAGPLTIGSAGAADLDPALEDPAQIYGSLPASNVVFGSGWYVRGDAAVTNGYTTRARSVSSTLFASGIGASNDPSYNFSLGAGYAFPNHFRADLQADFFQPAEAKLSGLQCPGTGGGAGCSLSSRFNRYDALVNGYYDFGVWSIATPYVGVGVGVGFGNIKGTLYGGDSAYEGYHGYQNFAFAGMAGVAFDVYDHVKLDVGYRYVNSGKVAGVEISNHEARAGLRYMIDN